MFLHYWQQLVDHTKGPYGYCHNNHQPPPTQVIILNDYLISDLITITVPTHKINALINKPKLKYHITNTLSLKNARIEPLSNKADIEKMNKQSKKSIFVILLTLSMNKAYLHFVKNAYSMKKRNSKSIINLVT